MKAKYAVSDDVMDVGMRVFITSFMIENGFQKGMAKNISKKEVEVLVDLVNKDPEAFRSELESAIHQQFRGTKEPQKIKVRLTEATDGDNPIGEIPDIILSSQMLQLEQMSKFINVGSEMSGSIKSMSGSIKSMSGAIDSMGNDIKTMGREMKDGFDSMGKQMKEGFDSMGKQMKEGFDSMGKQMMDGFELLAKAFKR